MVYYYDIDFMLFLIIIIIIIIIVAIVGFYLKRIQVFSLRSLR